MKMFDSLKSLVSGLGTDKDKTMSTSFAFRVIPPAELSAMHRSDWLSRKVVDIIPNDMTREWRIWQADEPQVELLEELEAKFNVQPKVNRALQTARLYGGAAIVIGIKGQDPAEELIFDSVKKDSLEYLHVLTSMEIKASELNKDVTSPFFGEPLFYEVNSANGMQAKIHPSRVVRLVGAEILDRQVADSFNWGDSVLQIVYDAITNASSAQQHIAALIPEAKTDVVYIPGLAEYAATTKGQTALTNRFTYANVVKSMFNMLLLDGTGAAGKAGEGQGEKWEQKQINFAQLPELMQQYLKVASGAADIPIVRMLSDAPSGLGSNGDSALMAYYDNITARQRTELTPTMTRLDEVIIRSALGSRPPELYYDWAPLWSMSDKEKAEVFKLKADAVRVLAGPQGEIIPIEALSDALINRLVEDGDLPGLEAAIEEYGKLADQEDDDEQLLAAATQRGLVAPPPKMVRAANDAKPRSLYVRRDVLNKAEIQRWAKEQGLKAEDDLHVTIMYSTTAVDWFKIRPSWQEKVEIVGGPRQLERLGPPDSPVVALLIPIVSELRWRHEEMKDAGAEPSLPEYVPHITIQKGDALDMDDLEPYQGRILLGPEIFEEVHVSDAVPFFFVADKKKKSQTGEGNPGFDPSQPRGSNGQWINTGAGDPVKAAAAKAAATSKYSAEKVQGLTSKDPKSLSHYEKKVLAKYKKELAVKKAEAEAKYNAAKLSPEQQALKAEYEAIKAKQPPAPANTPPAPSPTPQPMQTAATKGETLAAAKANAAAQVATSKYSKEKVLELQTKDPKTLSQYEKKVLSKYKYAVQAEYVKLTNAPGSVGGTPVTVGTAGVKISPDSPEAQKAFAVIAKQNANMQPETVKKLATGEWQPDPNKHWQLKAKLQAQSVLEGKPLPSVQAAMAAPTPIAGPTLSANLANKPPPITSKALDPQTALTTRTAPYVGSEISAIRAYTGSSYIDINGALRKGGMDARVASIDAALSKSQAATDLVLVRGVKSNTWMGELKPGAIVQDKGYLSTTRQASTAASFSGGGYGMKISVPKGSRIIAAQNISSHSEDEFILPRNSRLLVKSYDPETRIVEVDLLPD